MEDKKARCKEETIYGLRADIHSLRNSSMLY